MTPNDRKYTKDHEWVLVEGNVARIGITDYAQHALGDIVYVELPVVDDGCAAGDAFAVVESVKAVSSVFTPVSGTVTEANAALEDEPQQLNETPYESWIALVEMSDEGEVDQLMDAEAYDAYVATLEESED